MNGLRRFTGLLREDLKSKMGMIAAVWYSMGMFCLVFSMKTTFPTGEVRSLYVGPGNTSFFAAMVLFGILMGAGAFRFLRSEPATDLYFGLPFTRRQLFVAGWINNLFIFAVPLILCRLCFFRISLAMGYSRYEESVFSVWMGCLVSVLGFLFVLGLSMTAYLLAQNDGYRIGLFGLFLAGPGVGLRLSERMLEEISPSFYRSELLERLEAYLPPLSLLSGASGVQDYEDGVYWLLEKHLPYIMVLAGAVFVLTAINLVIFCIRPAERTNGMFTFRFVEWVVRYGCLILAGLWLASGLQAFALGGFSGALCGIVVLFGVPVLHGLLNMILAFDARKFVSAKWHLLAEIGVMFLVLALFSTLGGGGQMPTREEIRSIAVTLPALASGGDSETALEQMRIEGDALPGVYEWIESICGERGREKDSYELLVKYELEGGRSQYCRYWLPGYALDTFDEIFAQKEYKLGTYEALRMDNAKYYEVQWTNGTEQYTLDLDEEERQALLAAYQEDLEELTFAQIRLRTPLGRLDFVSTKNQGDISGYIYPGFSRTLRTLAHYDIAARKQIEDYEIVRIVVDRYLMKEGLLYHVRYLADQQTITDPQKIGELAEELYAEELCVDQQLHQKDQNTEYTVYYRDSAGQTVNSVKCLKGL